MKGKILDFNSHTNRGIVICDAGNRYEFSLADWKSTLIPVADIRVDFLPNENTATELYSVEPRNPSINTPISNLVTKSKTSALSVVSLIMGILGIFIFGSLIAIICGHIARSQIRKSDGALSGDGMAIAGLVLGYIGIIIFFFVMFGAVLLEKEHIT